MLAVLLIMIFLDCWRLDPRPASAGYRSISTASRVAIRGDHLLSFWTRGAKAAHGVGFTSVDSAKSASIFLPWQKRRSREERKWTRYPAGNSSIRAWGSSSGSRSLQPERSCARRSSHLRRRAPRVENTYLSSIEQAFQFQNTMMGRLRHGQHGAPDSELRRPVGAGVNGFHLRQCCFHPCLSAPWKS